jgi:pimeloyl-ACP methyl ester carboxylesterase
MRMSKAKTALRWLAWSAASLLAIIVCCVIVRAVVQERIRTAQAIHVPPGIDSMEAVEIGGIKQWIHIRGRDRRNPILLYLHGGPGTPMMPFAYTFQTYLEGAFTVVEWDQRGAGKTYYASDPALTTPTINYERMTADALEMVDLLRKRFAQPKIFLIGHSWGSMLGLPLVHAHPELFYAYVGTGQVVNARENERTGYEHVLAEAQRRGDAEAVKQLQAIAPYPDPVTGILGQKQQVVRHWEFRYGFALYGKTSLTREMLRLAIVSPDYSLHDFYYFVEDPSHDVLDRWIDGFDAAKLGGDFQVPIVFIFGRNDWQVPGILAEHYLAGISAPAKGFYWVEKASHSPMVEQPQEFAKIMVEHVRPFAPAIEAASEPSSGSPAQ